jgi:Tfp pilus assembly protein PilW
MYIIGKNDGNYDAMLINQQIIDDLKHDNQTLTLKLNEKAQMIQDSENALNDCAAMQVMRVNTQTSSCPEIDKLYQKKFNELNEQFDITVQDYEQIVNETMNECKMVVQSLVNKCNNQ